MKNRLLIKVKTTVGLLILAIAISFCSKKDEVLLPIGSATIKGTSFTASGPTATNTGGGLNIELSDGNQNITIALNDKTSNTYSISSGSFTGSNKSAAGLIWNHIAYYASAGYITIMVNSDGKVSGSFDLEFTSKAGDVISASDGKFSNLTIDTVPIGCRIKEIAFTTTAPTAPMKSYSFFYNRYGKLSRAMSNGYNYLFIYDSNAKLVSIFGGDDLGTYVHEFFYDDTLFIRSALYTTNTQSIVPVSVDFNYSYTGDVLTGVTAVVKNSGVVVVTEVYAFTYDKGNIIAHDGTWSPESGTNGIIFERYSNFDNKKNPYRLLAQSTGTPISFDYGGPWDDYSYASLNANNYQLSGNADFYTYTYTAQDYPSEILHSMGPYSETIAFVYEGCQ